MAAAAWDVLAKAANLAQMSGLHAAVLVAVLTTFLRIYHSNRRECARLEQCHRRLNALLQCPATDCGGVALLMCSEAGDPFRQALGDATSLGDSYKGSTLWHRLWSGGRMATQLRNMQEIVNSYCGLLLFVNAHLLLSQQATQHPPSSETSASIMVHEADDTSQSASTPAVTGTQRANDIGQRGTDKDPATGSERNVPDDLLPIVISNS